MIKGVKIKRLKIIPDKKGAVKHMLKKSDAEFIKFGEIYFSFVNKSVVKAWRMHSRTTLNYAIVSGKIKLVLYDNRMRSTTKHELMEIYTGERKYELITIPPGIWYGFKSVGKSMAIIANLTDYQHDPKEINRMDPNKNNIFSYSWTKN